MRAFPRRIILALAVTLLFASASGPLAAEALAVGDDPVLRRMDAVLEENTRLRDEAWKSRKNGKDAGRQAAEAFEASETRLEKTRAEALAHVAGVSPAQVEAMRRDGKSWGQAAGELGVHPGFLGIGKAPMYEPAAVRKAQARQARADKALKGKRGKAEAEPAPSAKAGVKAGKKAKEPAKGKAKGKAEAAGTKKSKKKKTP